MSSNPTSRRARAACAISTRSSGSANTPTMSATPAELVDVGLLTRAEYRAVPPRRELPLGGALPPPQHHRPRRGPADLRPAARDRRADALRRPARQVDGRALHAVLLPAGEDGRRSDRACSSPISTRSSPRAGAASASPTFRRTPAQAQRLHARSRPAGAAVRRLSVEGSGPADRDVRARRQAWPGDPSAGDARRRARRAADRRRVRSDPARQRAVPRRADQPARSRKRCCAG